jgi:pimeloyl-ACP methyl ester carboxylesterase
MRKIVTTVIPLLLAASLCAQDVTGTWQGTLHAGAQDQRLVIQIVKNDAGAYSAELYSIDQSPDPLLAESVDFKGSNIKLGFSLIGLTYQGKLSSNGSSIEGTATQDAPLPLELKRATKKTAWQIDPSPHKAQFVRVDKDVRVEVLDWGGSGIPLVLLTGMGNTAHVYDKFAPKLAANYHIYGVTRRGFGASSHPADGYSADRLGDDVLAVVDALKLDRPVLVGHSIGGSELSSVGSRHPEKVAGLIYLDAGYCYAYYPPTGGQGCHVNDAADLKTKLLTKFFSRPFDAAMIKELLDTDLPAFERDLRAIQERVADASPGRPLTGAGEQINGGLQKYNKISAPILAIFAVPHDVGPLARNDPAARAKLEMRDEAYAGVQATAFENGLPTARVVRIAHANHYVFQSNEADVLREMNAFLASLPTAAK